MKLQYAKPKKIKKSTLRNKADALISLWIRSRGFCQIKGLDAVRCSEQLNDMHIRTRGVIALRYSSENHLCGCSGHHVYYTNNPAKWKALVKKNFLAQWKYIEKHQNDKVKRTEDLYRAVIARYSKEEKV